MPKRKNPLRSAAYRCGFGRDEFTRLTRAYSLIGCYDHTPLDTAVAMADKRIRRSRNLAVLSLLREAREIIAARPY